MPGALSVLLGASSGGGGGVSVGVSPVSAIGTAYVEGSTLVTTNEVIASASGGTEPYTYAWTRVAGPVGFDALTPSAASTRFRITLAANEDALATFRVTATDMRGRTGTFDIEASAYNFGNLGGF